MTSWRRVTKSHPCPICGKPDWCTYQDDAACCMRVESPKLLRNGGYLHRLNSEQAGGVGMYRTYLDQAPIGGASMAALAELYRHHANGHLKSEARTLGVSEVALRMLGCGWDGEALTFPMQDVSRRVIGIRRRFPDGRKLSVRGGHEGVFVASNFDAVDPLYVVEGPTDVAAMLSIGCNTIGRPSCCGATKILVQLCKSRVVVVIPDRDQPGIDGARRLMAAMLKQVAGVSMTLPPENYKDVREWIRAGATRDEVSRKAERES